MKNFSFVLGLAFLATFALTSCKKDYTCSCTYKDLEGKTITLDSEIKDASKKDAEDACDKIKATWTLVDPQAACELK